MDRGEMNNPVAKREGACGYAHSPRPKFQTKLEFSGTEVCHEKENQDRKTNTKLPNYAVEFVGHMGLALAQEVEANSFL